MKQQQRFILFVALSFLIFLGAPPLMEWLGLVAPPKPKPEADNEVVAGKVGLDWSEIPAFAGMPDGPLAFAPEGPAPPVLPEPPVAVAEAEEDLQEVKRAETPLVLGQADPDGPYALRVDLSQRGAGVEVITLAGHAAESARGRPRDARLRLVNTVADPGNVAPPFAIDLVVPAETDEGKDQVLSLGDRLWEVVPDDQGRLVRPVAADESHGQLAGQEVVFRTRVEPLGLTVTKTFRLRQGVEGLSLLLGFESEKARSVSYRLHGPHGLPIEGEWFTSSFREVFFGKLNEQATEVETHLASEVLDKEVKGDPVRVTTLPLKFAGVENQYFATFFEPDPLPETPAARWDVMTTAEPVAAPFGAVFRETTLGPVDRLSVADLAGLRRGDQIVKVGGAEVASFDQLASALAAGGPVWAIDVIRPGTREPLKLTLAAPKTMSLALRRAGETETTLVFPKEKAKADVSVRLLSKPLALEPGATTVHAYRVFAGPKTSAALTPFGADDLSVYRKGWQLPGTAWIARNVITPLLGRIYGATQSVAGLFGGTRGNWGIAIILLTITVRLALFPLSRKQAVAAKKMQDLQPRLMALKEKHKDDKERLGRETMEIYREAGVNPFGGCLLAVVQMPIFFGLWQALNNSVDLRGASFLWIDNLAAPDMLLPFPMDVPFLGPYLNVLPFLVVALMLVHMKLFSPPAATPEQAQSQKIMKYMMVFMAFMFYKVPSGLGIYFITSSTWAIAERVLLPKHLKSRHPATPPADESSPPRGGPGGKPAPLPPGKPAPAGKSQGQGQGQGQGGWRDRLREKLAEVMDEASKDRTHRNESTARPDKDRKSRPRPRPDRRR